MTERSPKAERNSFGCLGYAALGLFALTFLILAALLVALLDWAVRTAEV